MARSDWREPTAYTHANSIPAAGFAWEYLRRDGDYRQAYRRLKGHFDKNAAARADFLERWGLRFPNRSRSTR